MITIKRWDFTLDGKTCPRCHGTGWVFEQGDLHRSSGSIPCPGGYFQGHGFPMCHNGKLFFRAFDRKNQDDLKKRYPAEPKAKPVYNARNYPL